MNKKNNQALKQLSDVIDSTINPEIGATLEKGNLILAGCHKDRDRLSKLFLNSNSSLLDLEEKYRKKTGIQKLRVKYNNLNGYFIEISKGQSAKAPKEFERRQTLVNCERFVSDELAQFEKEVLSAKDKLFRLERQIFDGLIEQLKQNLPAVLELCRLISTLDVFQSLAFIAVQDDLVRPGLAPRKKIMEIRGGWHPLIKSILKDQFVPHDLHLDEKTYFGLITGPNMAGKTTVMREAAIIQFLAQIGSFVPAKMATLGLCDFLFSRLGASDNIRGGQSTFMVEMSETAEIVRHATSRSLIILDEIGRGTSTYDGLSIAWALMEYFVQETRALCLFATHYHELIDLAERLDGAKNFTVETLSQNGNVQFLYRLIEKGAAQSYGLYVAKLAGLPKSVLNRSEDILKNLEQGLPETQKEFHGTQLSFFGAEPEIKTPEHLQKIEDALAEMDIMQMTPLDAMVKLSDLKNSLPLN